MQRTGFVLLVLGSIFLSGGIVAAVFGSSWDRGYRDGFLVTGCIMGALALLNAIYMDRKGMKKKKLDSALKKPRSQPPKKPTGQ